MQSLKAPFPWFGGKSRVAHLVWERFGNVTNYVEPFAGSLAVLLARPHPPGTETVNDIDAYICNFWRAVQADPDAVARYADWPVNEADLHARHRWLIATGAERLQRIMADPDYYDAKVAGWWLWGICLWIGSGWCQAAYHRKLPYLAAGGRGVHRKLSSLGSAGRGVHQPSLGAGVPKQRPHLTDKGQGMHRPSLVQTGMSCDDWSAAIRTYMRALCDRLRRVRVCCGDWTRVLGPGPTVDVGTTGVFLDPPYPHAEREADLYAVDLDVYEQVRDWAIAHGDDPRLRIALCGYDDGRSMPDGWTKVNWRAQGGYGNQGNGRGRANAKRETIWFSPHCLRSERRQLALFDVEVFGEQEGRCGGMGA